ncbi:MAG TPA: phage major capsid protein [Thermomicrobiaceae bacterium]|nr:phage major capsid protein [Thermomicrobiaceae bacterium]
MDKRYHVLVDERAALVRENQAIFASAEAEERGLTPEEQGRDDAINARLVEINAEIARLERQREHERSLIAQRGNDSPAQITTIHDRALDDPKRGFTSMADFGQAVYRAGLPGGTVDERLRFRAAPANFHQEQGSSDGYMVPPDFNQQVIDLVNDNDIDVLNLVNPGSTSATSVQLLVDESTFWSGNGIQSYWRSEGVQMQPSRLVTNPREVRLHELYAFVLATEELLADAAGLNERLTTDAAGALRWKMSEAIVRGSGVGQPLGFLNSNALITVAKENGQAAGTVNATNVAKMYARLVTGQVQRAFWLANSEIIPQLMTMSIANQPIWIPPSGFMAAPGGYLLGRPIYLSEHAEALGTAGDLMLVNPVGYLAYRRTTDPVYADSMHLYFDYNMHAFRWIFRFGGEPYLSAPIAPARGAASKSHFVVLADRG